ACFVLQPVHLARLGDVPVLAELAGEVAARGAERKDARARIEVVERLLLHRIDAESGGAAVGRERHAAVFHLTHEAQAALAFVQPAIARAQVALDAAVREAMPPLTFHRTSSPCSAKSCSSLGACRPAAPPCAAAGRETRVCREPPA